MKISRKSVGLAVDSVLSLGCRKATVYLDEKTIVRATAQFRLDRRNCRNTVLVTVGAPNFLERRFIRVCKKAGEPLPVRKVQLVWWPEKKK